MSGFERSVTGRIHIRLADAERGVIASLAQQLVDLVTPEADGDEDPLEALVGITPDAQPPEDPALARLLPPAYRDDEEAADEFRRFTDRTLRETKVANARTVLSDLERSSQKVRVSDADSWLGFLTDTRLTIGTRLGITAQNVEEFHELPPDDPRAGMFAVYDWLTYLQETLVRALMGAEYA
jgi:hypothetical protein